MSAWTPTLLIWLFCSFAALELNAAEANLSNHKLSGLIQWKYEKRPFCNAFTGCGKKRGPIPPYPLLKRSESGERAMVYNENGNGNSNLNGNNNNYINNEDLADGLSDLIDINAEPAVENVQKQIMSQAKIFEAIREASKEIFRQKNKQKLRREQQLQQEEEERQRMMIDEPGNA